MSADTPESTTTQIAVLAKVPAAPGKRAELAAALRQALIAAESEVGTLAYLLHEDAGDADVLWMYEVYANQEALDVHQSSATYKALGPAITPFLGGRPELTFMAPIGGKGQFA